MHLRQLLRNLFSYRESYRPNSRPTIAYVAIVL